MAKIKNKTVIITGASSGIGRAASFLFAETGAKVVLTARTEPSLDQVAFEIRKKTKVKQIMTVACDVTKPELVNDLIEEVLLRWASVDVLINCAGVLFADNIEQRSVINIEHAQKMMEVNYFGTLNCINAVLPQMIKQKQGHIVNISSVAGLKGIKNLTGYCASKFAIRGFSESLRASVKKYNIKVSVVYPYLTQTPLVHHFPKERQQMKAHQPIRPAKAILQSVLKQKNEIIVGFKSRFFRWL